MRRFMATAAVAASAAATVALSPLAAHAATPPDSEIRTACANGVSGVATAPDGTSRGFALSPGSQWDILAAFVAGGHYQAGLWTFNINQPAALESYGPGLDADRSFEFAVQRVEKAVVNSDDGKVSQYFNDKANGFTFFVPERFITPRRDIPYTFHVYYQCGLGKS